MSCKAKREKLHDRIDKVLGKNPLNATEQQHKEAVALLEEYIQRPLDKDELGVFEVINGQRNKTIISNSIDGFFDKILLEKGFHNFKKNTGKGAKHILVKHYGENKQGVVDFVDFLDISEIIKNITPKKNNGKYVYEKYKDNIRYRVIIGTNRDKNTIISFFSNKSSNQGEGYNALRTKTQKENVPLDNNDSIIVNGLVIPYADTIIKAIAKDRSDSIDKAFDTIRQKLNEKDKHNILTVSNTQKEVGEMLNEFYTQSSNINKNANDMKEMFDTLSDNDSRQLVRVLNGDADVDALDSNLHSLYSKVRKQIDKNADELIDVGALDKKNKIEHYVKRYYKEHIEQKDFVSKAIYHSKRFRQRKSLTEDERIALGMIEDANFVIPKTLSEQKMQILRANTLKVFADKYAKDEAVDGYVHVSDATNGGGVKKWGALAGKYIPKDVMMELKNAQMVKDDLGILEKYWYPIVDHIKVNVTVKNPATHMYNIGSNLILSGLNGDSVYLAKVLYMAKYKKKEFKELVDKAEARGLNSGLKDFEDITLDDAKKPNFVKTLLKNLYMTKDSKTGDGIRKLYDWEDKIFKLASFKRLLDEGVEEKKAYKLASETYVDYSTPLPSSVRVLDKSGISPFLHYVYKSVPATAKIILKNPGKFALLQIALITGGLSVFNEDDDMYKPNWAKSGVNFFGVKEWFNINDSWYLNTGRLIPAFKFSGVDMSFDTSFGFVGGITSIASGKTPLGYSMYNIDDNDATKLSKKVLTLMENYLPPMTFGRYGQRATQIGLSKVTDKVPPKKNYYDEDMSIEELAKRGFGIRKFNEQKEIKSKSKKLNNKLKRDAIDTSEYRKEKRKLVEASRRKGLLDLDSQNKSTNFTSRAFLKLD